MARNLQKEFDYAVKSREGKGGGYIKGNTSYDRYLSNTEWELFLDEMKKAYKRAFSEYSCGGGGELNETRYPPKMACFGSSSRFIYLLSRNIPSFSFERKLSTTVNGGEANLDGWLRTKDCHIFVEAKCREIYASIPVIRSSAYLELLRFINASGTELYWVENEPYLDKGGYEKINCEFTYKGEKIRRLDLMQLICHFLGIGNGLLSGELELKRVKFLYLLRDATRVTSDPEIIREYSQALCEERALEKYAKELFGIIIDFLSLCQGVENRTSLSLDELKEYLTLKACNEEEYLKEIGMDTRYYTVTKIEGEYAYIREDETGEEIFIAMFLLPEGVDIGTKLKYEMLEYEIID